MRTPARRQVLAFSWSGAGGQVCVLGLAAPGYAGESSRHEIETPGLDVSQNRVSAIERGDIDKAQVDTLRRHVQALGGRLEVAVSFGDESYRIA